MSWGYWGLVAGLSVLLTVLLFCIDFLHDMQRKFLNRSNSAADTNNLGSPGNKHVA
jgi:hypothetical protein